MSIVEQSLNSGMYKKYGNVDSLLVAYIYLVVNSYSFLLYIFSKYMLMIMKKCSHLPCLVFQQECEELARKVADLTTENSALRAELDNLKKACQDMEAENSRLLVSTMSFAILFHHHLVMLLLSQISCHVNII